MGSLRTTAFQCFHHLSLLQLGGVAVEQVALAIPVVSQLMAMPTAGAGEVMDNLAPAVATMLSSLALSAGVTSSKRLALVAIIRAESQ